MRIIKIKSDEIRIWIHYTDTIITTQVTDNKKRWFEEIASEISI